MSIETPNPELSEADFDSASPIQGDLESTGEDWEFESCEWEIMDEIKLSAMREFDISAC